MIITIDGYLCEFEGEDWEDADPDVGLEAGFCSWGLVSATDDCGFELSKESLKELSDAIASKHESVSDDILDKLNCERLEQTDSGYLDDLDFGCGT